MPKLKSKNETFWVIFKQCDESWGTIFSLHFHVVWSSLLTSQLAKFPSSTQLTPFWYTNSIPFGEISDYLFLSLRLEMMITFVLRLILLRKLVLFSFHMLRSFKRVSQKTRKQQKEGHTVSKLHILSKNSVFLLVHLQISKIQSKFCKKIYLLDANWTFSNTVCWPDVFSHVLLHFECFHHAHCVKSPYFVYKLKFRIGLIFCDFRTFFIEYVDFGIWHLNLKGFFGQNVDFGNSVSNMTWLVFSFQC